MLGIHGYWLFVATGALLNLLPGQDTMFIIGRSLTGGRSSGIAAAFGISTGCLIHTTAAALGLSAILAASTTAFTVIKLMGAAYLFYLGIQLLRGNEMPKDTDAVIEVAAPTALRVFYQGMLTNVLNPKVALFFLAFLPQFVDPMSQTRVFAFLVLGITFLTTGTAWCLIVAVASGQLRALFIRNPTLRTWIDRITGTLFLALGIRLAASHASR
jgi:threonine/homoserine/homoserine lactone efflux protein